MVRLDDRNVTRGARERSRYGRFKVSWVKWSRLRNVPHKTENEWRGAKELWIISPR